MKKQPTPSESLLEMVREKLRRDGVTLHRLSDEIACNYISIYYLFHPERRQVPRSGRPRFTYDTGKALEQWLLRR